MTTPTEDGAGVHQPGQTALDRLRLWLQRRRAHSCTITPREPIEAVETRPDSKPIAGTLASAEPDGGLECGFLSI